MMQKRTDERISKFLKTVCEIPSLAAAIERLVQLSDKSGKEASPRDFAELIEKDQGLTAKVLRLVNSAFYSLRESIGSPRQASALLGTKTLRSLVLSVSVAHIFKKAVAGLDPILFWRHSIATAVAAQRLARLVLPKNEDDLYVAGLFHDAGVALFARNMPEDYERVLRAAGGPGRKLSSIEDEFFGVSHAEVAWTLASRWKFPSVVCDSIRFHEADEAAWILASPQNAMGVSLVQYADALAVYVGLDFNGAPPGTGPAPSPPSILDLDPADAEAVTVSLASDVEEKERILFPDKLS